MSNTLQYWVTNLILHSQFRGAYVKLRDQPSSFWLWDINYKLNLKLNEIKTNANVDTNHTYKLKGFFIEILVTKQAIKNP